MKCENCTKKECIKKTNIDDQQNVSVDTPHFNSEHEEKCDTSAHKVLVVSICPQSLPYFAAKFNISVTAASKRLCGFLKSLGVHYVFDSTIAVDFSVLESQKEFIYRYRQQKQGEHSLPMFASACPGWIQYAERVLGNPITPHMCTAKTPQQIMGSLVKDYFARQQNYSPDKIFHIIVAPCYDKKLEALREDFYIASYNSHDVDCVLTSGEIIQIMEQKEEFMKEAVVDTLFGEIKEGDTVSDGVTRSDGYLEHIFKYAAKELFDLHIKEITYRALKNKDFQEITLEKNGEIVLRFAAAYGFRNIQNMVLKLKKGKFPYHFVEVLACPGDDCALKAPSEVEKQQSMDQLSPACANFGLTINTKKIQVLHQLPPHHLYVEPSVTANGEILNVVNKFAYLGSILSRDVHFDNEVDAHIARASSVFGHSKEKYGREEVLD
ncbi:nuclear prelamin A recognition factor isoform X4 [Petaurus breviceps papuanus]|uniref:nuclear prelamin A recognition factor isoform X4 n=1 Tax=Petaurus breviceps papuanus TaxID=3040969 RepID=UPI0036D7D680